MVCLMFLSGSVIYSVRDLSAIIEEIKSDLFTKYDGYIYVKHRRITIGDLR